MVVHWRLEIERMLNIRGGPSHETRLEMQGVEAQVVVCVLGLRVGGECEYEGGERVER